MQHNTIIIGAGHSGLTAGYFLKRNVRPLLILEASKEVGTAWKKRYDSLVLLSPAKFNALPKFNFPLSGQQHPSKDEMASYLKHYAGFTGLPVHLNQKVKLLKRQNGSFWIESNVNSYLAKNVIVATGAHQHPYIPSIPLATGNKLFQLHSADYKNPSQVPKGRVLIVGGGNTASDIALDLSDSHDVYLSTRKPLRFRKKYNFGMSWLWWREASGLMHIPGNSLLGEYYKKKREPIYGLQLKHEIDAGKIKMRPEVEKIFEEEVTFVDGAKEDYEAVIWATGFKENFSWIDIPELFDSEGKIKHRGGVSEIPGLYFMGLDWQRTRSSSLIAGVARDAKYIAKKLLMREKANTD